MKQIFTLLSMGIVCLFSTKSFAQFTQDFNSETPTTLSNNCWTFDNNNTYLITNGTDKYIALPISGQSSYMKTPYIKPSATNLLIGFKYQLASTLNNGTRSLEVRLDNILLQTISVATNTTAIQTVSIPASISSLSVYPQLQITLTGSGGNAKVYIDDINVTGLTNTTYCTVPQNVTLPIHLKSFSGNVNNDKAQLTWTAADNETGNYFEVQKSTDGKRFESAAMIFTTSKVGDEQYSYGAATTLNGAFYRLKVVNKDNSVSYSKVIYLKANDAESANKVTLLQNPVHSSLSFSFVSQTTEPTEIAVYNMAGVKILHQKAIAQKGSNTISIDMTGYNAKGNYVLQLTSATTKTTTKFIKY